MKELNRLLRPYVGTSAFLDVLDGPRPYDGTTPLWVAAAAGQAEAVRFLAARGADVNAARARDHATPLYIAARLGHLVRGADDRTFFFFFFFFFFGPFFVSAATRRGADEPPVF